MKPIQLKFNSTNPLSIIDIGSFSIRLVVYDSISVASRTLFNEKVILNLGAVVKRKGKIDKKSEDLLLGILERFISISKSVKIENLVILATSAIRNAKNKNYIVNKVFSKFGLKIKVLSGKEEGILSAFGTFYSHKNVNGIVGDLGGGSLELTQMEGLKKVNFIDSMLIGHTVLQDIGPPNSLKVKKYLEENLFNIEKRRYNSFFAVGGSFRVIAKLNMFFQKKSLKIIQDYSITVEDFRENIVKKLFTTNKINLEILENVTKSRRNSIPYAVITLEKLIEHYSFKNIFFSSSGIREGYIQTQLSEESEKENILLFQVKRIAGNSIKKNMVETLYKWIKESDESYNFNENVLLSACWASNIAWDVHPEHRRLFAMERILWYPFNKITRFERIELAVILYFRHSNGIKDKILNEYLKEIDKTTVIRCKFIGQCLRLAHHITGGISEKNLDLCFLKNKKNNLKLYVKEKKSIFYGEAIPRGLKNVAQAMGLNNFEIKFL